MAAGGACTVTEGAWTPLVAYLLEDLNWAAAGRAFSMTSREPITSTALFIRNIFSQASLIRSAALRRTDTLVGFVYPKAGAEKTNAFAGACMASAARLYPKAHPNCKIPAPP